MHIFCTLQKENIDDMNKIKILIILLFCSLSFNLSAEESDDGYDMLAIVEDGDTLPFEIAPVVVIQVDFTKKQWEFINHIKKTLPYARALAKEEEKIAEESAGLSGKAKREYVDKKEDELNAKYKAKLMKMSSRRGKVLIKLINREYDAYAVVKGLKGGFKTTIWQGMLSVFGLSLRSTFTEQELKFVNNVVPRIDAKEL